MVVSVDLMLLFQLALSPSPRNPAEPIAVQNNQQLALKVEGVVQHGSKPGLFRKIQSVCLNVSSTLQSKSGQEFKVIYKRGRIAVGFYVMEVFPCFSWLSKLQFYLRRDQMDMS